VSNRFLYRTNIAIRIATSYKFLSNFPPISNPIFGSVPQSSGKKIFKLAPQYF
jgi:hypothetical protein